MSDDQTTARPSTISTTVATAILGVTRGQLARWRRAGVGPPYYRMGWRTVVYDRAQLEEYLAKRVVEPRAVPGPGTTEGGCESSRPAAKVSKGGPRRKAAPLEAMPISGAAFSAIVALPTKEDVERAIRTIGTPAYQADQIRAAHEERLAEAAKAQS